jgi:GT2 family glycosyltransferase
MKRVYILVLNWNGWRDTIECLESIFRLDYPDFRVIVCDNDSSDGSIEKIKAWADGSLNEYVPVCQSPRSLSSSPTPKPVEYACYGRNEAESGGIRNVSPTLTLIQTGDNLGFAGGNNVGLRYALSRGDFDYVWLLNNDTVVRPDALDALVKTIERDQNIGICGSTIFYYDNPDVIWALGGGRYNHWCALPRCIGIGQERKVLAELISAAKQQLDYVAGASMLVSHSFLTNVGLMCEDYFLFFEELDWHRKSAHMYRIDYSPESVVYHKVSNTIKSATSRGTYDYYMIRSRVIFTFKFHKVALIPVIIRIALSLGYWMLSGEFQRLKGLLNHKWIWRNGIKN